MFWHNLDIILSYLSALLQVFPHCVTPQTVLYERILITELIYDGFDCTLYFRAVSLTGGCRFGFMEAKISCTTSLTRHCNPVPHMKQPDQYKRLNRVMCCGSVTFLSSKDGYCVPVHLGRLLTPPTPISVSLSQCMGTRKTKGCNLEADIPHI